MSQGLPFQYFGEFSFIAISNLLTDRQTNEAANNRRQKQPVDGANNTVQCVVNFYYMNDGDFRYIGGVCV